MKKLFAVILAGILAVGAGGCAGNGKEGETGEEYEKLVEEYVNAMFAEKDAEKFVSLFPEEMMETSMKEDGFQERDEYLDSIRTMMEQSEEELKAMFAESGENGNVEYSYKISSAEDVSDGSLDEIKTECEKYGFTPEKAKSITFKLYAKCGETSVPADMSIYAVETDGEWFLCSMD